jgi:hypothetical protein
VVEDEPPPLVRGKPAVNARADDDDDKDDGYEVRKSE